MTRRADKHIVNPDNITGCNLQTVFGAFL